MLLRRIIEHDPEPLRSIHSSIPRDLETIIARAIGKEPADRYETCGELGDDARAQQHHSARL